ncbi:MAG: M23 family metallopeptidase [Cyanothece sp. SIO2G6]|nr:M23 family metallopeptidase [Cyanothece sp. SIO2G6]
MFIGHYQDKTVIVLLAVSCWFHCLMGQAVAMVTMGYAKQSANGCPPAVLDRLTTHIVSEGETLATIAEGYGLLPSSIAAFNPTLQLGTLRGGDRLQIPPYDGSIQTVGSGTTWQMLADRHRMRADVLFETNGCAMNPPNQIFVPGAAAQISGEERLRISQPDPLTFDRTPIAGESIILTQYGWQDNSGQDNSGQVNPGQVNPDEGQLVFHPGVDFFAPLNTTVQAVADGTVAFVGDQEDYGLLIVINHARGIQTRYAQLSSAQVNLGDTVIAGQDIGQSGQSGTATSPHLHFEVRLNSNSGWLAQDPTVYLDPPQL